MMISTVVAKGMLFAFSTTYPEAKPPNRPTMKASVCAVDRMSVEYSSVVCTQEAKQTQKNAAACLCVASSLRELAPSLRELKK